MRFFHAGISVPATSRDVTRAYEFWHLTSGKIAVFEAPSDRTEMAGGGSTGWDEGGDLFKRTLLRLLTVHENGVVLSCE